MENKEKGLEVNPDYVEEHPTTSYYEDWIQEYRNLVREQQLRGLTHDKAQRRMKLAGELRMPPEPIISEAKRLARLRIQSFIPQLLVPSKTSK